MALEIEHQLRAAVRGLQQRLEPQARSARRRELPAIPQHGERPGGLEVTDLQAAAVEMDVSFGEREAERGRGPEPSEVVARTVRHDERQSVVLRTGRRARVHRHDRV